MRKTCAKPVDYVGNVRGHAQDLYSALHTSQKQPLDNPLTFPQYPQAQPTTLSTVFFAHFDLLKPGFPTLSTALITNTIN